VCKLSFLLESQAGYESRHCGAAARVVVNFNCKGAQWKISVQLHAAVWWMELATSMATVPVNDVEDEFSLSILMCGT
jgi:hypothetical protein